jgi:RNase P subunit RPR2
MEPLFTCQQCFKIIGPERTLNEKVYKGQSVCVMCRKAGGQQDFTPEEKLALFAEETLEVAKR